MKGVSGVVVIAQRPTVTCGSVVVFRLPPRDWLAAGILTPRTPLHIERVQGGLATVRRADGRPFPFAYGTVHRTRIPLALLLPV